MAVAGRAIASPPANARRSMPAQNARSPVPVSTTARTSASASAVEQRLADGRRISAGVERVAGLGPVQPERPGRARAVRRRARRRRRSRS